MGSVCLKKIRKSYANLDVIHGLDLEIKAGEFIVFVGPSGCGKSTLLRLIAGLDWATAGQIWIAGRDVTRCEPIDRNVAMVFQSYALYPHMSVAQNMGFALGANGLPAAQVKERVTEAAKILRIEALLDRKPRALSGGQRQRVAIGRAIVRQPGVFLFDEPLSNLDAELRVRMRFELEHLHKRLKTTMIYVTHDQVEAMTLADRVVVLRGGRIEQVGAPLRLFDDPDNRFVAGFIGTPKMNFLPATVAEKTPSETVIVLPALDTARLVMPLETVLNAGATVTVGIRPEHLLLGTGAGAQFHRRCEMTEQLGDVAHLYLSTVAQDPLILAVRDARQIGAGDLVEVTLPAARAFVFDAQGQRIR